MSPRVCEENRSLAGQGRLEESFFTAKLYWETLGIKMTCIGLCGPNVGTSIFANLLTRPIFRQYGHKISVISIDPPSTIIHGRCDSTVHCQGGDPQVPVWSVIIFRKGWITEKVSNHQPPRRSQKWILRENFSQNPPSNFGGNHGFRCLIDQRALSFPCHRLGLST